MVASLRGRWGRLNLPVRYSLKQGSPIPHLVLSPVLSGPWSLSDFGGFHFGVWGLQNGSRNNSPSLMIHPSLDACWTDGNPCQSNEKSNTLSCSILCTSNVTTRFDFFSFFSFLSQITRNLCLARAFSYKQVSKLLSGCSAWLFFLFFFWRRSQNRGCPEGCSSDNGTREAAPGFLIKEGCQSTERLLIQQSARRPIETLSLFLCVFPHQNAAAWNREPLSGLSASRKSTLCQHRQLFANGLAEVCLFIKAEFSLAILKKENQGDWGILISCFFKKHVR